MSDFCKQCSIELLGEDYKETILDDLPEEHPLRNTPLYEIGAYYQLHTKGTMWHEVRQPYGIAKVAYNQLAPVWREHHTWKATK